MGGGEDPEVLQKVPQTEISAEGVKKEGFHFDDNNLDMMRKAMMVMFYLSESRHKRAMEEAHWRRRLCSITPISVAPQQIRWTVDTFGNTRWREVQLLGTNLHAKWKPALKLMLFQFDPGSKIRRRLTLGKQIAQDRWLWWLLSWSCTVMHGCRIKCWVILVCLIMAMIKKIHVKMGCDNHWQGGLCGELLCEAGLWVRRRGKQVTFE